MNRKIIVTWFLIGFGFFIRFAGLFFLGNQNYEIYHDWGRGTRLYGLADSFTGGYGPIAYMLMSFADYFGAFTPSIWWWPYKGINLIFELLMLLFLFKLLPKNKLEIIFLYWLNPWFLIPGSWQGFWDAAFAFFILLTVFILDKKRINSGKKYFFGGFIFSIASLIKPQIVAPMSVLGLIFLLKFIFKFKFKELFLFVSGFIILPFLFNFYFFLNAKGLFFLWLSYKQFAYYMPFLVNSEINIWHTVTRIIMFFQGINGPIYSLNTLTYPYNILEKASQIIYFAILFLYILKTKIDNNYFLNAFTFAFILMPQILTRSHAYHFFTASLLLIPLLILTKNKYVYILWTLAVFAHFYNIWWRYGLGEQIGHIVSIPGEPILSLMGILSFIAALGFIKYFLSPRMNSAK